jgi:capsular polysaccharide transport system ATP-binding protein
MIEFKNINKSYRTSNGEVKHVLKDVSFSISPEMNIGILGRNGAGKSTMLKLLSGLELPDAGEIITGGRCLSWALGSNAGVHGSLTGKDNIKFICRIFKKDFDDVYAFVENFAELGEYINMPVKTYSSGMKSRLAFGISMAIDFDTYLIDEGFSAGDARFRKKTMELFTKRSERANMIIVSHNPKIIMKMCNIVGVLNAGQITIYQDIKEGIEVYQAL